MKCQASFSGFCARRPLTFQTDKFPDRGGLIKKPYLLFFHISLQERGIRPGMKELKTNLENKEWPSACKEKKKSASRLKIILFSFFSV